MKQDLTVPEYAGIKGVSTQYVYKLLQQGKLDGKTVEEKGKKKKFVVVELTDKEKSELVKLRNQTNQQSQPAAQPPNLNSIVGQVEKPEDNQTNQPDQPEENSETEDRDIIIEFLMAQIREKDKQIEELHKLLNQEQQLHAAALLPAAEENTENKTQEGQTIEAKPIESKKRGWFYRWFFGEE